MNPAQAIAALTAYIEGSPALRRRLADEAGSVGDIEQAGALADNDPSACLVAAEGIFEMAHEGHMVATRWLAEALEAYEPAETIGERLAELRNRAGLTQAELAERAGMLQPAIARLERRAYDPPAVDALRRIREALGCTWDELLG